MHVGHANLRRPAGQARDGLFRPLGVARRGGRGMETKVESLAELMGGLGPLPLGKHEHHDVAEELAGFPSRAELIFEGDIDHPPARVRPGGRVETTGHDHACHGGGKKRITNTPS